MPKDPLPLCACGCGQRVKRRMSTKNRPTKWATPACVPRTLRVDGGKLSRVRYAERRQFVMFEPYLARLSGRITKQDLWLLCHQVYKAAYNTGYHSCDSKWKRRIAYAERDRRKREAA